MSKWDEAGLCGHRSAVCQLAVEEKKESGKDVLKSSFFSRGLAKESAELGADPAQETTDK